MKDSKDLFRSAPAADRGAAGKATPVAGTPSGTHVKGAATPSRSAAQTSSKGAPSGTARPASAQPQTGKVVHDERGNAVWDWLKQTGRNAIESTTRMLKKLEAPELKVEQAHEEELRIQPDNGNCGGGGYDPYNQPIKSRRTPTK
jgi:hypothetical protein